MLFPGSTRHSSKSSLRALVAKLRRPIARRKQPPTLSIETLESRRLLAASLETDSPGFAADFENDPRLIAMFHGPLIPGRPVPSIQGVSPAVNEHGLYGEPTHHHDDDDDHDHDHDPTVDGIADGDFPLQNDSSDGPTSSQAAPFPAQDTFNLHSRPDSNFTIYLDFDGHTTIGTSWNSGYGITEIVHPNYWGGTGSDFSESRLELIQEIWQIVAEDFAPFDVNVTTEEPSDLDDLRYSGSEDTRWGSRVVMTKDTFANCGCGGHAYLGSFDDPQDEPSLVYNSGLNAGSETVSHEVGHQLGLNHDGAGSTTYYRGHGSGDTGWGPIMGAPFSKRTTQWNAGDYFNASNPAQDDLNVITRSSNFPYLADDHSNDRSLASPLLESNLTKVTAFGIIERNTDVDWFRFTTGEGQISLNIDVLGYKPNLDVWAGLFDSDGQFITDSNPQDALSASFDDLMLDAGEYFIKIDGVARDGNYHPLLDGIVEPDPPPYTTASPLGYSDYGSLGQYHIHGSIVDPGTASVSIETTTGVVFEGQNAEFTVTSSDGSDPEVTIEIRTVRQKVPGTSAPNSVEPADFPSPLTQVISLSGGSATVQIPLIDDDLIESTETFEVHLIDGGGLIIADRVAEAVVQESKTSFSVFATDAIGVEGDVGTGQTHLFNIRRNGRTDLPHTVGWRRVSSGTDAADEADFESQQTGTITFAAGEIEQPLEVMIAGDLDVEPNETYSIELLVPDGQSFDLEPARSTANGRIDDDESIISLTSTAQFRMRQVAFNNGSFDHWAFDNFRITGTTIDDDFDPGIDGSNWDQINNGQVTPLFPLSDGNALFFDGAGDRSAITIPVSPPPGSQAEFSIVFAGENMGFIDATENGEDAVLEYSLGDDNWIEIERFDESEYTDWTDLAVTLPTDASFSPSTFAEGNEGTTTRTLSIPRTGYLDKAITVNWAITPGTTNPVSPDDFVGGLPSGTVQFEAGQPTADIEIEIVADLIHEADETFLLTVSSNSGGPIINPSMSAVITNDDYILPEINVTGLASQSIVDGDLSPSIADGTDFGIVPIDSGSRSSLFTIENLGVLDLQITSVSIGGPNAGDFSIFQSPATTVVPGENTALQIMFDPSATGVRNATVEIENNDPNESPYEFAITGLGSDLAVESVEVNEGSDSRSRIDSIKVTFTEPVQHQMLYEAIEIRNLSSDESIRSFSLMSEDVNGKTETVIRFGVGSMANQPLSDGNYELRLNGNAVVSAGNQSLTMAGDFFFSPYNDSLAGADAFFQLFGDINGDRIVDLQDLGAFAMAFNTDSNSEEFDEQFDFNTDGRIDSFDLNAIRTRLGRRLLK